MSAAPAGFHRIVWPIAVAETIVWASIFYLFPALLIEWERHTGWSKTELSGAFTAALIVSALLAPLAGRLIDHGHARTVFCTSTALAALLLMALSRVHALWQFYGVWIGLGLCMAGTLYEPCFAYLTRFFGTEAKRAITTVTLVAGFAGTVAFPGANALAAWLGWRGAVMVFAALLLGLGLPLMWLASPAPPPRPEVAGRRGAAGRWSLALVLRRPVFWLLAVAFAMIALEHNVLLTHLLPLLDERGVGREGAVLAAAMIGPMQVAGRLLLLAVERQVAITTICLVAYALMAAACLALLGAVALPALVIGFVALQGAGYGATSITRPVATAHYLGHEGFGTISGALAIPFIAMAAVAPTLAALVWRLGGYDLVIALALAAVLVGSACFFLVARMAGR